MSKYYDEAPNDSKHLPMQMFAISSTSCAGRNGEVITLTHPDIKLIKDEKAKVEMYELAYDRSKQRHQTKDCDKTAYITGSTEVQIIKMYLDTFTNETADAHDGRLFRLIMLMTMIM